MAQNARHCIKVSFGTIFPWIVCTFFCDNFRGMLQDSFSSQLFLSLKSVYVCLVADDFTIPSMNHIQPKCWTGNRPALMAATLRAAYGTGPQTRTPVTPVTPSVSATPHTPHGASLAPQCNPRTPRKTRQGKRFCGKQQAKASTLQIRPA